MSQERYPSPPHGEIELLSDLWNGPGTFTAVFDLAPSPRYRLARPPLVQALGQVRFPVRARLQTLDGVAPVQDRLDALFPYMTEQQVQQVSLLVGPAGAAAADSQTARTWRFTDDVGWALMLSADSATLAVGPEYGAFEEFSNRFQTILGALADSAGVVRCDRLGLRYVDIAELVPGDEASWRRWFKAELTGWAATGLIGTQTTLLTSITQTQLSARPVGELSGPPVDVQAIVRHGFIPPNTMVPGVMQSQPQSPAFLLDVDMFIDAPQPFEATELARQITMLHEQIDRFFRWSLTPEGESHFGLEELE